MPSPTDLTAKKITGLPTVVSRRGNLIATVFGLAFLFSTFGLAHADTGFQNLIYVAAIFSILAISLDLVAGMLGLYSLGQGGFFAIGAYLTTIAATTYEWNIFMLLPVVLIVTAAIGGAVGAMSLRVSGLYFAITTFIFTLVLTVLATNLTITGGLQGMLGPLFPDFPDALTFLGTALAWCIMLSLLLCLTLVWSIRQSPFYPVVLSIRDAEPFAESAGVRTALVKITMFSLSAAMAGGAGWLFSFLGVVSPGQFDWSVSLNVLVMILIGGINTTIGPLIGAAFVTMFPAVVNINPWLQEVLYGALSILSVTLLPEGVIGALRRLWRTRASMQATAPVAAVAVAPAAAPKPIDPGTDRVHLIECQGITFSYGGGLKVLRGVDLLVTRGQIHGLIGPNGSGKSTLANIVSGRLRPTSGTIHIKGEAATHLPASARSKLGFRRTFQAAELVQEISTTQNVMVGLYDRVQDVNARVPLWPFLPSARRDQAWMESRAHATMDMVGAGSWSNRPVHDVPHGIEQLTQLAAVSVAEPDIIVLDEPATGLSPREVEHLAEIISELKGKGTTVVIIEHQTKFLFPLCDEITVLNAGEVIVTGTPDEVRNNKTVRQVYLGDE